jgi:hypothetical protein
METKGSHTIVMKGQNNDPQFVNAIIVLIIQTGPTLEDPYTINKIGTGCERNNLTSYPLLEVYNWIQGVYKRVAKGCCLQALEGKMEV